MPSAIFAAYSEEHAELCAAVGRAISQIREQQSPDARRATQAHAEKELAKADEIVQQMELEARSGGKGAEARDLQAQAKARKAEGSALRTSLRQAAAAPSRAELLGGSSGDEGGDDQRARLLKLGDRTQAGTDKLQAAHRTVLETESIGASILGDLRQQRETIMHSAGTLQRANEGLARSKRTLTAIGRRALGNKLIMWAMIFLLSAAVLLLFYVELFGIKGSSKNATASASG